ncbi:hypothetical protein CMQ_8200 [Grosmannia clavigera kw1407]|uniref:Uncharacterized protein n=1 Tax=Grosmannia clavigera (strain kw1407 / UAMH 11150) TaxID=655863 RepID=F0XKJ0_GROCL|nr:uncharacterized protein CMQ_8200 [Grosmannia clavigera kw1407]EFX01734.1 hypothetical protein CMQ_8200 [Grosmannia clavigera kw1407]
MDNPVINDLEVVLKQMFQFWYYVGLLLRVGLAGDMKTNFVRLLRTLEDQPLLPFLPIKDVSESGWSIKNIMLDSMDKAESALRLPRPSSTSMAGRIVEVSIAVSRLVARPQLPLQPPATRLSTPSPPTSSGLYGGPVAGRPWYPHGHISTGPSLSQAPSSPSPPVFSQGQQCATAMTVMTDMRDEYFHGACHVTTESAEEIFERIRLIAPEAAFTYTHPVPDENIPLIVCSVVAWGLGSNAKRITPARLSSLTYGQIVNALMLSGKLLYRPAYPMLSTPRPSPGGALRPAMGSSKKVEYPSNVALTSGTRPGLYRPSQPYPTPDQPRGIVHGQDSQSRWVPDMASDSRQGPWGLRQPPMSPSGVRTISSYSGSDSSSSGRATRNSDSDSNSNSDSTSESEEEHVDCVRSKNSGKSKPKCEKGCKTCKCKAKTSTSENESKNKSKDQESSTKHGDRHSKKAGDSAKRRRHLWDDTHSDSVSEDDSDASSQGRSVTGSNVESDSEAALSGTVSAPAIVAVDSGSDSSCESGSDCDGWTKEDANRKKKSGRRTEKAAMKCCHKCEDCPDDDFVIVSRHGGKV